MTVYAFEIGYFIQYIIFFAGFHLLMAFVTGHIDMFPVKRELCEVVIEFTGFPVIKTVATITIRNAVFLKLAHMHVLVAIGAGSAKTGKLLFDGPVTLGFEMAVPAGLLLMHPHEGELCPVMIEHYIMPAFSRMAYSAVFPGIIFFIKIRIVDIFMAIMATDPNAPEIPPVGFFMADKTGGGNMCSLKGENALVVLFNGIGEQVKTPRIMAGGTVRANTVFLKLSVMIILMAIGTTVMFQRIRQGCFVARFAGYCFMLVFKFISSFIMIEIVQSQDGME